MSQRYASARGAGRRCWRRACGVRPAGERERLHQHVLEIGAIAGLLAQRAGPLAELLVGELLELRLQLADLGGNPQVVADLARVGIEQPGQDVHYVTTGSITVRPPSGRRKQTLTRPELSSRKT